ncbi:MAG: bifunctional diaminohydroxyphosphoribosylaminopyrimidine deaminase/5-amino-6-(5-phosphoribosylamino)uracil reductase RibD [Acidobacteriota bacterium]
MTRADDHAFMERALFWGERGRGRTSPNPNVGAVVVTRDGIVVGQGTTQPAGGAHAEVMALDAAGALADGATLYCTLEPCSHTGRTGPCVERIAAAGIARVVAALRDPNPEVSGRGFAYLRERGIDVASDVAREAAREQHAAFFTWITLKRPFVTVKAATSLDGFVGERTGRIRLTGPVADRYFHRQRAEIDAIAVGSGTVLVDDPLLTARGAYRFRPLTRVIFDWRGRVPATARVFSTQSAGPVIMVTAARTLAGQAGHFHELQRQGVEIAAFETRDLREVLTYLGARPIVSLLVEGGPALHAAFAEAALIDRAQWVVTPQRLGSGVPLLTPSGPGVMPAGPSRTLQLGDDLLIEFDVHGTDRSHRAH